MSPKQWMDRTFERYRYLRVRVISIPLPPVHVHGLIYTPDCFASKTFDKTFPINSFREFGLGECRAVSMAPSQSGPAILMTLCLGDLIGYDAEGYLTVTRSSCCATVSYAVKHSLRDSRGQMFDYADFVTLDNLNFSRSCNPGSHITVPKAPFLTSLLQYDSAPVGDGTRMFHRDDNLVYLPPEQGEMLFPNWDYEVNTEIDEYLSKCAVRSGVRYKSNLSGIGEWVVPYLFRLRTNHLRLENGHGEQRLTIPDHQGQEDGRGTGQDPDRGRSNLILP